MLNSEEAFYIAERESPSVQITMRNEWHRHDIVNLLKGYENIGIELGVARGEYSRRMLDSSRFNRFYGVDSYSDFHDTTEYKNALNHIGLSDQRYSLLRMTFDEAIDLFPDSFFDFIYIDGFAHTGQEGGTTIHEWFKKLRTGGVLSGDDYHGDWPLVTWAVNDFAHQTNLKLNITGKIESSVFSQYPSWYFIKTHDCPKLSLNRKLYSLSMIEKQRIHKVRNGAFVKFKNYLRSKLYP